MSRCKGVNSKGVQCGNSSKCLWHGDKERVSAQASTIYKMVCVDRYDTMQTTSKKHIVDEVTVAVYKRLFSTQ